MSKASTNKIVQVQKGFDKKNEENPMFPKKG